MFCHNCGTELQEDMSFCPKCGNPISDETTAPIKETKTGGFWGSMQDTVKNMGESLNKAIEEGKRNQQQQEIIQSEEEAKWIPAEVKGRFIQKTDPSLFDASWSVIVDKTTGVNYLFVEKRHAGGLTILVDENGKPLVTK
ncbi:MAG: zinc-ribbon domain-containing protein [Schwartzia succinivorans]|nr:zinc-ribbon domain-containing protein [Schwartzia succinivorans]